MITAKGPKLIEYNVRFGDPECQVLMLRLKSDLVPALLAGARRPAQILRPALVRRRRADGGHGRERLSRRLYKGTVIEGLDKAGEGRGRQMFMPAPADGGRILANGGRVLNVSAIGATVREARRTRLRGRRASTGPTASAAAISAGAPWSANARGADEELCARARRRRGARARPYRGDRGAR